MYGKIEIKEATTNKKNKRGYIFKKEFPSYLHDLAQVVPYFACTSNT